MAPVMFGDAGMSEIFRNHWNMPLRRLRPLVLLIILLEIMPATVEATPVTVPAGDITLTAELVAPQGAGPFPAVVMLHGCGGMLTPGLVWPSRPT